MIRKYNYTGRKKILHEKISISLLEEKAIRSFDARIDLSENDLPPEAKIYIEPYFKSSYMRFDFGSVAHQVQPSDRTLTEIPSSSLILFRVKIVDESDNLGRILMFADQVHPINKKQSLGGRASILHVDWEQDLDQQIFRVTFPDSGYPRLEINRRIDDAREYLINNPFFKAFIYPTAIKEIVWEVIETSDELVEGDDTWQWDWIRYLRNTLNINFDVDKVNLMGKYDKQNFIEDIVKEFCRKHRIRTNLEAALNSRK